MSNQTFSKIWILIILVVLIAGGILAWQYWPKEEVKAPEEKIEEAMPEEVIPEKITKDETANWKTYRNERIEVEFSYFEKIFGKPFTAWEENESIGIIFSKGEPYYAKEYTGLSFTAYTSDYKRIPPGFSVFTGAKDITSYCPQPLKMKITPNGDWKMCKVIEIAGQKAIFETFASNYECGASFDIYVYFNNQSSSPYRGLVLSLYRLEITNKILHFMPNCIGGGDIEKFESDFYTQSINIMKNQNLSEGDKEKLALFNQMLSTFRFLE